MTKVQRVVLSWLFFFLFSALSLVCAYQACPRWAGPWHGLAIMWGAVGGLCALVAAIGGIAGVFISLDIDL